MKNKIYYSLKRQWEAKFIGIKDGMSQAEFVRDGFINKNHYDEIMEFTSLKNQANYGNFPDFELNLEYVKMRKGAKLTDFISFFPHIPFAEYLISDKVVQILATFKMPTYKLYPVTIDFNGRIISEYKLLFAKPKELLDIANITKCSFYNGLEIEPVAFFSFDSKEDYLNHKREHHIVEKNICLNKTFDNTLDYFKIRGVDAFVSEDLKETFEIAGITGIKFVEAKEPELVFEN